MLSNSGQNQGRLGLSTLMLICIATVGCASPAHAETIRKGSTQARQVKRGLLAEPAAKPAKADPSLRQDPALVSPVTVPADAIAQDFAFDGSGRHLYLQSIIKSDSGETGFITRLALDGDQAREVDRNLPTTTVGHQGVSVEQRPDGRELLWTSYDTSRGRQAVRFRYEPGQEPQDVEIYTFFDRKFSVKSAAMPQVCADGKHLAVRGRTSLKDQFVRIFDLAQINAGGPGNYAGKALFEWKIAPEILATGNPVQGMACDDEHVYVLIGHTALNEPKYLLKMKFDGTVVHQSDDFSESRKVAAADRGKFEPEGMAFYPARGGAKAGPLYVGILSGKKGKTIFRLWSFDTQR